MSESIHPKTKIGTLSKTEVRMEGNYPHQLEQCKSIADVFELVKKGVDETTGAHRAGLMLGLAELGGDSSAWVGAFFPVGTNIIVMNKTSLRRIQETREDLYMPYVFHILLHEYLHTVGVLDETMTRQYAHFITRKLFGEDHLATDLARGMGRYLENIVYPSRDWQPSQPFELELVDGFDRGSVNYIN